ncbi:hypothetical protein A0256_23695 [Mucilaginibacter sp. PAMC 26640]|nr:hypothetical protein A0256_23695 [Mucilaginibacter sp. PAMC 26640]
MTILADLYLHSMKCILILVFIALLTCKASAQQTHPPLDSILGLKMANPEEPHLPTSEVSTHMGKDVYIYDIVWGHKALNDTLSILYIGGLFPKHHIIVMLQGKQVVKHLQLVREGLPMHFGGIVTTYEGKPAIIITNSFQFCTRIQI